MNKEVIMPALGMAQQTGILTRWLKREGESVVKGEPLMEIETDKVTVEIEATADGILSDVTAAEGDEIPIGPPTEYHSSYLALMQTNRAIFPIAKIIIYMNLFFGGATSWPVFFLKVFLIYMVSVLVGVVFPRFRVEQSIRWFLVWAVPLGVLGVLWV